MNAGMLAVQYETWAAYPEHLKRDIEIVLVDDGSPTDYAADVPRPDGLPPLRIYRVLEDRPWHQHAARNLGAHDADGPWLFLSDMDHVLPAASLEKLMEQRNKSVIYTFARIDAPDMMPTRRPDGSLKPHPNTFAMTREMYWEIGGYDERFSGVYGTDSLFRTRAERHAKFRHLEDVPVVRYPREVIPDASTRTLSRKSAENYAEKRRLLRQIADEGSQDQIKTLDFPWTRVV